MSFIISALSLFFFTKSIINGNRVEKEIAIITRRNSDKYKELQEKYKDFLEKSPEFANTINEKATIAECEAQKNNRKWYIKRGYISYMLISFVVIVISLLLIISLIILYTSTYNIPSELL